jgi:deazaflavin-dependent oxidoreductase (nitroreductase family)
LTQWALTALGALLVAVALSLLVLLLGMRANSRVVLSLVRSLNRRFVNPRQMRTAGKPGAYAGVIRHVGRRTGNVYETPVGPYATDGGFVIALPYGARTEWVKNVVAARSATLVTEGATYRVDNPEIVPLAEVVDAVPERERRSLRLFRVDQALRVRRQDDAATTSLVSPG